jgi:NADPH:quinone reductase-like Zn-dependent oxidoreductase
MRAALIREHGDLNVVQVEEVETPVLAAVTVNQLRPIIDEVFPLSQARDAIAKMEGARQFGKIVLRIAEQ